MAVIKIKESTSKRTKCSCCGEMIPTCENYSAVGRDKYCHRTDCHTKYLPMNHPDAVNEHNDDDDERHLREREAYAAYRAAGCTQEFYSDRDAGYIR